MSTLVVYDSIFGNTADIAKAIAAELGAMARHISSLDDIDWAAVDLLVVGSPTRGFRPTPAISEFCSALPEAARSGLKTAVFDTRIALETISPAPLRWVVDAGGYAAERMAHMLAETGATAVGAPGGFIVTGQEGPLRDGELTRARDWARTLVG